MRFTHTAALIALIIIQAGCSVFGTGSDTSDLAGKKYAHLLFDSKQDCRDFNERFFMNCAQTLEFKDSDTARIMLTDIINEADYFAIGDQVVLMATDNTYEFEDNISFKILDNGELLLERNQTVWKEYENSIWE